jgi:hypothetical protein
LVWLLSWLLGLSRLLDRRLIGIHGCLSEWSDLSYQIKIGSCAQILQQFQRDS